MRSPPAVSLKADLISKKYASGGTVDAIAQASGQAVQQSDSATLGNGVPGIGYEPRLTGYIFNQGFQLNTLSPGIKGNGGVFFITVLNRNISKIDDNIMNMIAPQQRRSQEGQLRNAMNQQLQQSVIKTADVKYNASNF